MKYKKEISAIYKKYKNNPDLTTANIFHMYAIKEYGLDNNGLVGFHDSQIFKVTAFNYKTMEKIDLGEHDGIHCYEKPDKVRLFLDGSTMVIFRQNPVVWENCQELYVGVDNSDKK